MCCNLKMPETNKLILLWDLNVMMLKTLHTNMSRINEKVRIIRKYGKIS